LGATRFENLRAAGAFLVSASYDGKSVSAVALVSEKGLGVSLANPWGKGSVRVVRLRDGKEVGVEQERGILSFPTTPGAGYRVERVD
jgi:hypothetical protein